MSEFRRTFREGEPTFQDMSGQNPRANDPWAPVLVSKKMLDTEIERLADIDLPANGRRQSLIVHPQARADSPGLAPGIQVMLSVLKPGEATAPFRQNATEVNFCTQGGGHAEVDGRKVAFSQYDVWNTPSFVPHRISNDTDELQVRFTYSNAPLLQHMEVHHWEDNPALDPVIAEEEQADAVDSPRRNSPYGIIDLGEDGSKLMPYELLINPPSVESRVLHWEWEKVEAEIKKLQDLGKDYVGRRLYLMYNPMTGRTNGTTPNFFATITIRPPNIVDRPHRHVSSAINYYFKGSGYSVVAGNRYEWREGDLMLSAPGWAVHNHASYDEPVYELTIQDQPLNIIMESLLWQENLKQPPVLLGAQMGFDTNRSRVSG